MKISVRLFSHLFVVTSRGHLCPPPSPKRANRFFRLSPIYYDELIWLPLLGLDGALIELGKKIVKSRNKQ